MIFTRMRPQPYGTVRAPGNQEQPVAPNEHLPTNAPAEEDLALDSLIHEMDLPAMLHAVEEQPPLNYQTQVSLQGARI